MFLEASTNVCSSCTGLNNAFSDVSIRSICACAGHLINLSCAFADAVRGLSCACGFYLTLAALFPVKSAAPFKERPEASRRPRGRASYRSIEDPLTSLPPILCLRS